MTDDLVLAVLAIGLSLVAIPLFLGYTFVLGTVPPTDSVTFYGLASVVMTPGLLMGATALWLAARSDPS